MYAIVDIETTGSHASANGITEIAICIHNGVEVVERFESLINPGREIPVFIQALTGIDNEMVSAAPPFRQVAARVHELLQGKIFVAHNVNFDYSFVRHHLADAGFELNCNKLCTVRLGRKILPGMPSYSLGKLCRHLGIDNEGRHRAMGDAAATAKLFSLLLRSDTGNHIKSALKQRSKEQQLPANLPKADVEQLPLVPGVYYFHDQKGKVIYVGKAVNIRKRVLSHFSGNNPNRQRQEFLRNIFHITYQECGTELMAFALEAVEIKRLWPAYNRSLKRFEQTFGIYAFEDQRGYIRLAVDKQRKHSQTVYTCRSLTEGYNLLNQLVDEFELCPKLCFIQKNNETCNGKHGENCACGGHEPAENYAQRVGDALRNFKAQLPTLAIRDRGRTYEEHSCLLIENGRFFGMGYIAHDAEIDSLNDLKSHLKPYADNGYILNMVLTHAERHSFKIVNFRTEELV